jgi:hypothetical protein
MSYVVYKTGPCGERAMDAQQAEACHELYWPTVRLGTFGQVEHRQPGLRRPGRSTGKSLGQVAAFAPQPTCRKCRPRLPAYRIGQPGPFGADASDASLPTAPLGVLAVGSVVLLPAGSVVVGPGGDRIADALRLVEPASFRIGKSVDVMAVGQAEPSWSPTSANVVFNKDVAAQAVDPIVAEPVASPGSTFTANPGMSATVLADVQFAIVSAVAGSDTRFAAIMPATPGGDHRALNRAGMIIAVASAITVVGLFAATLSLGKPKGA